MYDMRVGGVETVLRNTINALLEHKNVEITLYCHRTIIEPTHIDWLKQHPQIKVKIYYPFARFFDKTDRKRPISRFFKRICFEIYKSYRNFIMAPRVMSEHFDAIIDYISGYSAKPLKKIHGSVKLTWIHCSMDYFKTHNLISGLSQYDTIVTISDSFLSEFKREYPQYANRAVRVYNPVNLKDIQKKLKSATIPDGKYFSCVSRLDDDKDITTVLYAFDKFCENENHSDVELYIVGGGAKESEFKDIANKLSVHNHIIFTGNQSNPFGYMAGSMAHILSSYNEGLPTVLIESMALNTLNISSNCPVGPHEILLDGHAGVLFKPGNIDELAQIMGDVYNKKIKPKTIINNATKSLIRFDSKNIANEILNIVTKATR